jgi:cyclopropane-fatty-acyl-phospholipid synthase
MESGLTTRIAKRLFLQTLRSAQGCFIEVVCQDGVHEFGDPRNELHATIAVHDETFFRRAVLGGDIGVGESYMAGEWSSPDLVSVVRAAMRNMAGIDDSNRAVAAVTRLVNWLRHLCNDNSLRGSRRNIAYHYDLGNDFYRMFLDESMAYSCAYYEDAADSLKLAQVQKFDRICRKLELGPGDHLLEIGTGWGGFAAYAASTYGCRITTTTISRQQYEFAESRFAEMHMGGEKIKLLFEDYRHLKGQFDKIVSIEMFEAVGFKHYDEFFTACDRLLKPQGAMLLQTITMNERNFRRYLAQSDWIKKYIFPGAELASVSEMQRSMARCTRLQMTNLEDIGLHYALTLRAWRERFLERLDEVRKLSFDERFLCRWEFYLAYCEGGFRERYIGDAQMLMVKTGNAGTLFDHGSAISKITVGEVGD